MTDLSIITLDDMPLMAYSDSARRYARKSKADHTLKLYGAAWREFEAFAAQHGAAALPASMETVTAHLVALADNGAKVSTIEVKRAAVGYFHRLQHHADPTAGEEVKVIMSGIRREIGTAPAKKAPVKLDELRKMIAALPDTLAGKRDRALLLVGWAGAFRRSELVALDVSDLHINGKITITIRHSKTDQEGRGMVKTIPPIADAAIDPVAAVRDWLAASDIKSGALFRAVDQWGHVRDRRLNDKAVAGIVKSAAQRAGLEPVQFAGHSLRSGFITTAAEGGAHEWQIQEQTGHKSERVLRGYIQAAGRGAQSAVKIAFGEGEAISPAL
jgi:integrase